MLVFALAKPRTLTTALQRLKPLVPVSQSWLLQGFGLLLSLGAHLTSSPKLQSGFAIFGALRVRSPLAAHAKQLTVLNVRQFWDGWVSFCSTASVLRAHSVFLLPKTTPQVRGFANAVGWSSWTASSIAWRIAVAASYQAPIPVLFKSTPVCIVWFSLPPRRAHASWFVFPSLGVSPVGQPSVSWTSLQPAVVSTTLQYFLLAWLWKLGAR